MKYLALVWAGLWRKRMRTVLTWFSVAAAFLLFGILHGVTATIDDVISLLNDSRLRSMSSVSILEPMPLAHLSRIESVKGVEAVSWYSIFFGYYQEPSNGVGVGAVPIDRLLETTPEILLSDEARDAMLRTRTGAVIGKKLAEERGWKVGDRIPLRSSRVVRADGAPEWVFDVVGIYEIDGDIPAQEFWINYDYFDEARSSNRGTVNFFFERTNDASRAAEISENIDSLFANSADETETASEREWARSQVDQIGDIDFFVNAIIGAVLFTLLILTGNTMMQSVRERIPELAVLKTYGYTDSLIILLVCVESILLCGCAALAGLLVAGTALPRVFSKIGAPPLDMPFSVVATGLVIAIVLALVSAVPPVWRVRRLNVVDALAGR